LTRRDLLLGLDIGTTVTKCVLVDPGQGVIATDSRPVTLARAAAEVAALRRVQAMSSDGWGSEIAVACTSAVATACRYPTRAMCSQALPHSRPSRTKCTTLSNE
jgi:sugar (pentulose or hexulose) kinase